MQVALNKWGNSVGFRMPNSILQELGIECGNRVEIKVENGRAIIEPVNDKNENLIKLLEAIVPENLHSETSTNTTIGKEII